MGVFVSHCELQMQNRTYRRASDITDTLSWAQPVDLHGFFWCPYCWQNLRSIFFIVRQSLYGILLVAPFEVGSVDD